MEFKIVKIILAEQANPPKIEVLVTFSDQTKDYAKLASVRVDLDWQDYTISEIKAEAIRKAKEFLSEA